MAIAHRLRDARGPNDHVIGIRTEDRTMAARRAPRSLPDLGPGARDQARRSVFTTADASGRGGRKTERPRHKARRVTVTLRRKEWGGESGSGVAVDHAHDSTRMLTRAGTPGSVWLSPHHPLRHERGDWGNGSGGPRPVASPPESRLASGRIDGSHTRLFREVTRCEHPART
jgi:hypothetical protein